MWDCWSGVEVMNSTTVCLTPSNKTVAQALLALLEFFGWRQAIVFTDLSTPNETIAVSCIPFKVNVVFYKIYF